MICPYCQKSIVTKKANIHATELSRKLLEKRGERFRQLFTKMITKTKIADHNDIYTFLKTVEPFRDEWVVQQMNNHWIKYKDKAKPLSYLLAIMRGGDNDK